MNLKQSSEDIEEPNQASLPTRHSEPKYESQLLTLYYEEVQKNIDNQKILNQKEKIIQMLFDKLENQDPISLRKISDQLLNETQFQSNYQSNRMDDLQTQLFKIQRVIFLNQLISESNIDLTQTQILPNEFQSNQDKVHDQSQITLKKNLTPRPVTSNNNNNNSQSRYIIVQYDYLNDVKIQSNLKKGILLLNNTKAFTAQKDLNTFVKVKEIGIKTDLQSSRKNITETVSNKKVTAVNKNTLNLSEKKSLTFSDKKNITQSHKKSISVLPESVLKAPVVQNVKKTPRQSLVQQSFTGSIKSISMKTPVKKKEEKSQILKKTPVNPYDMSPIKRTKSFMIKLSTPFNDTQDFNDKSPTFQNTNFQF